MFETITHPKQRAFLAAYSSCASVKRAAKIAGISRELHYDWKAESAEYAEAFEQASKLAGDALEDEAARRAQLGVREPFVYRGQVVMHENKPLMRRRYSDTILLTLLRGHNPKYRDKTEVSGPGGKPIEHRMRVDLSGLSDAELDQLDGLSRKACRTQSGSDDADARELEEPLPDSGSGDDSGGTPETPATED